MKRSKSGYRRVLPGFGISLGVTVGYATVVFLLPVAGLTLRAAGIEWPQLWRAISSPAALSAYRLTLLGAAAGALFNAVFGFITAWVLVRYRFPLQGLFDVIVDIPFALPGAVGGLALAAVFAPNGLLGRLLLPVGIQVAFAPLGIFVTYVFVGLPFVIRSVQPVLANLEYDEEEAAGLLGARPHQTFLRVILPAAIPATITGATLAFARAIGDYGTVIFMAGNVPLRSEVATRLIYNRFDQFDLPGATAVAAVMMLFSFILLFLLNSVRTWSAARGGS